MNKELDKAFKEAYKIVINKVESSLNVHFPGDTSTAFLEYFGLF